MAQDKSLQDLFNELDNTEPTAPEDNELLNPPDYQPDVEEPTDETPEEDLNLSEPEPEPGSEPAPTPEPTPETETPPAEEPAPGDGIQVDALEEAKKAWLEQQKPAIDVSELDQMAQGAVANPVTAVPGEVPTINLDDAVKVVAEEHGEDAAMAALKLIQAVAPQMQATIEHTNLKQMQALNDQSAEATRYFTQCKEKFYEAYPELNDHIDVVKAVTAQVSAENPKAMPHQLLNEIGKRTTAAIQSIKESMGDVGSKTQTKKPKVDELGASPSRSSGSDRIADMKAAEQERLSDSDKHLVDLVNFVS